MKHFDAEKLKAFRTENHFSQSEIASQLYVSRTVISNWENGKSQPNLAQLNQLENLYLQSFSKENAKLINKVKGIVCYFLGLCSVCAVCIGSYKYTSVPTIGLLLVCMLCIYKKGLPGLWLVLVIATLIFTFLHYIELHYGFLLTAPVYTTYRDAIQVHMWKWM